MCVCVCVCVCVCACVCVYTTREMRLVSLTGCDECLGLHDGFVNLQFGSGSDFAVVGHIG